MRAPGLRITAVVLAAAGCGSTEPLVPTTLDLDDQLVVLEVGESVSIAVRILDQHGDAMAPEPDGYAVTWSRSNPGIVSVADGVATGVGPGTATVTAHAGGLTAFQEVEVHPRELSATLSFAYDGDREGTFDVESTFRILEGFAPDAPDWAVTVYHTVDQFQDFWMGRVAGDGRLDLSVFWASGQVTTPGTHPVGGVVFFGFTEEQTWDEAFVVTDGQMTFTSATTDRLSGTFEMTLALEMEGENGAGNGEEENGEPPALTITAGTFDVPVVSMEELNLGPSGANSQSAGASVRSATPLPGRLPEALRNRLRP